MYKPAFLFDNAVLGGARFSQYWQQALTALLQAVVVSSSRTMGVTAAIATGTAVTHNLQTTPTFILITPQDAGPTDPYVSAITSTTFTVNFGGGGSHVFGWSAEA